MRRVEMRKWERERESERKCMRAMSWKRIFLLFYFRHRRKRKKFIVDGDEEKGPVEFSRSYGPLCTRNTIEEWKNYSVIVPKMLIIVTYRINGCCCRQLSFIAWKCKLWIISLCAIVMSSPNSLFTWKFSSQSASS